MFYQWYLSKGKEERKKATRGPFLNYNLYLINIGRLGRGIFFLFYNIFFSVEPKSQPKTVQLGIFYNVLSRLFTFTTVAMCLFTDFPAQSDRPDVTSEPTCNSLIRGDNNLLPAGKLLEICMLQQVGSELKQNVVLLKKCHGRLSLIAIGFI